MRIALAAELDAWAHKTYAINHPEVPVKRVLLKDLTAGDAVRTVRKAVANEPNLVLVFGGPPCQNVARLFISAGTLHQAGRLSSCCATA